MKITTGTHGGHKNDTKWRLLDEGWGIRTTDYLIPFGVEYQARPQVHVSLNGFDILRGENKRLKVIIQSVQKDGFLLRYQTWANTRVWAASVSWIAIGNVRGVAAKASLPEGVSEENEEYIESDPSPTE